MRISMKEKIKETFNKNKLFKTKKMKFYNRINKIKRTQEVNK